MLHKNNKNRNLFEEFRFLQTKLDLLIIIIIINTLFEVGKLTYLFQKYTV